MEAFLVRTEPASSIVNPAHIHMTSAPQTMKEKVFVFGISWALWRLLAATLLVRVSEQVELLGQDVGELGIEAYPEFVLMPEEHD